MTTNNERTNGVPSIVPQERLAAEVAEARDRLATLEADYEGLLADASVIQEDRDSTRILLEAARDTVARLERALARAEAGNYGRCVRCGGEIAPERLEVIPDTDSCVRCGA
jgi:DnaK suppressor protein